MWLNSVATEVFGEVEEVVTLFQWYHLVLLMHLKVAQLCILSGESGSDAAIIRVRLVLG
jgi:hypothetical protein